MIFQDPFQIALFCDPHPLAFKIRIKLFRLVVAADAVINMEFQLILTPSSAHLKKKVNPFFGQSLKYKSNRLTCISLWS